MLGNLSVLNPIDPDRRCRDALAGWRNAVERSAVFALGCDVCNKAIPLCDLLHDLDLDFRESREISKERLMIDPKRVKTAITRPWHRVVDTIFCPELFQSCEVSTVPNQLDKVLDYLLVFINVGHQLFSGE